MLQEILKTMTHLISRKNRNQHVPQEIWDELNRSSNLSEMHHRIDLCRQALALTSKKNQPEQWVALQEDLACSLLETPSGPRAENIEEAILHFQQALEVKSREADLKSWSMTMNNLATAYRDRIRGNQAENVEQAIDYYEQALEVRTRETDAKRWAMTQINLADAYYRRIEGKRAENLEHAIEHAEQALEVFTRETSPQDWAQAINILGEIYRVRTLGSRMENIELSIKRHEQALEVCTRDGLVYDCAMIRHNLGIAYTDRIHGVREKNIEQALRYCQLALKVYTRQAFPQYWASIQYNLGNALRYRIRGDRLKNIEQAIDHLNRALEVRTRQAFPDDWAHTQNNLGNVYLARIKSELEKNIEQAIAHYKQALEVHTWKDFPSHWAQIQNNLGNAYLVYPRGDKAGNVKQAIACYEQALKVQTRDAFPEAWAETINNLADAKRMQVPEEIEQSIQDLEQVLQVYTRETFPQNWARTQNNLAMLYSESNQGDRVENIERAIDHYHQALQVYTPYAFSDQCVKTARALANLAFDEQRWKLARESYDIAISAQDVLLQASFSRESEKAELAEIQNLPPRAAYAYIKSGDVEVERAVEVLEKGRAQLLRVSYEHQWLKLEKLPGLGFQRLYDDYTSARNEYQALQGIESLQNIHLTDWERALEKVQSAISAIREEAGQKHPQYRYFLKTLPFEEIQAQAQETPLVYLCATSAGGLALTVNNKGVHVTEIPEIGQETLQKKIWRPSNDEVDTINKNLAMGMITRDDIQAVRGGYFSTYALWNLRYRFAEKSQDLLPDLFEAWQESIDETTHWLWDVVLKDLVKEIKNHGQSVILIPAGQLALLPLHAAWTEDLSKPTGRRYALDEISISYVPSAHILRQAKLAGERPMDRLMAVDNPDGTLLHSKVEVRAIIGLFDQVTHLPYNKATRSIVKNEMQAAHVLHFSTHGRAGWEKPEQARLKLFGGDLTLPDIYELDLNQARLAVLSACETGIPGVELIDEMIGLPAGMMQSGVPGVVGTLWSVDDMSTAMLMARFYTLWRNEERTPQDALYKAQAWLRDHTTAQKKDFFKSFVEGKRIGLSTETANAFFTHLSMAEPIETDFSSPYYWAAFAYTGV